MAHDVFISYPHENKLIADAICSKLESNGVRCWVAPRDILPGQNYAEALLNAIDRATIFVLVFSQSTNNSPHIMSEVTRAFNANKIIIPFRIENIEPSTALEYYIGNAHWLDALTPPLEKQIDQLFRTVSILLAERTPPTGKPEDSKPSRTGKPEISPDPAVKKTIPKPLLALIVVCALLVCIIGVVALIQLSPHNSSGPGTTSPVPSGSGMTSAASSVSGATVPGTSGKNAETLPPTTTKKGNQFPDVSGTWLGTLNQGSIGTFNLEFEISQDGNKITGTRKVEGPDGYWGLILFDGLVTSKYFVTNDEAVITQKVKKDTSWCVAKFTGDISSTYPTTISGSWTSDGCDGGTFTLSRS
jgi:hypothetical protein